MKLLLYLSIGKLPQLNRYIPISCTHYTRPNARDCKSMKFKNKTCVYIYIYMKFNNQLKLIYNHEFKHIYQLFKNKNKNPYLMILMLCSKMFFHGFDLNFRSNKRLVP